MEKAIKTDEWILNLWYKKKQADRLTKGWLNRSCQMDKMDNSNIYGQTDN